MGQRSAELGEGADWEVPMPSIFGGGRREGEAFVGKRTKVGHMLADEHAGPQQRRMHRAALRPRVVDIVAIDPNQPGAAIDEQLAASSRQEG
jgi:hypothetical protein